MAEQTFTGICQDLNENKNVDEKDAYTANDATNLSSNGTVSLDLSPKHHIRSPIIEEIESGIEPELLVSRLNFLDTSATR